MYMNRTLNEFLRVKYVEPQDLLTTVFAFFSLLNRLANFSNWHILTATLEINTMRITVKLTYSEKAILFICHK